MDYYSVYPLRTGRLNGIGGASVVIIHCVCGWFDSFPSFDQSPSTCPQCSKEIVTRNQTDMDEIINPVVDLN